MPDKMFVDDPAEDDGTCRVFTQESQLLSAVFVVLPKRYGTCCCFYSKEHRDKW
jgi:hypothetical protein